jgi:hypothetical protein
MPTAGEAIASLQFVLTKLQEASKPHESAKHHFFLLPVAEDLVVLVVLVVLAVLVADLAPAP